MATVSGRSSTRRLSRLCLAGLFAISLLAAPGVSLAQVSADPPTAPATDAPVTAAPQPADPAASQPVPLEAEPVLPHDLSPIGMFKAADWIVKAVMIGLAFASVVTWSVWLAKALEMLNARRKVTRDIRTLRDADSLAEAREMFRGSTSDVGQLVEAAAHELQRSRNAMNHEGIKERVASLFSRIEAGAAQRMTRGTSILATIGSTGPFVGLFGTVWGIMNSFIGISKSQTTNLAVVAPGIAEALLATALGLVAAIPAVVIYNMFARSITGYRSLLSDASAELMRMVSRDLDRLEFMPRRSAAE
ncbi:tonB-system energizer ExbB [Afipia sp. P52-10]|uniref:tonB-system energizer ExbB n=1 Tax=Afipia sp. P52-10 TaxID=1429916 RepID=UPI0004B59AB5|nr:tonB-system energizer ExbB [Afipia sp. P52-10]